MGRLCEGVLSGLIVYALVCTVPAVDIRTAPYGVMTRRLGEARTYAETFQVVFQRTHPRVVEREYLHEVRERLARLLSRLRSLRPDLFGVFSARIDLLQRRDERTRRSIDILGEALKWIAGTATMSDINAIRDTVNDLARANNEQNIVIKDTILCVKENTDNIDRIISKANTMIEEINLISQSIVNTSQILKRFSSTQYASQIAIHVESMLSYLEQYKIQTDRYEDLFQYRRDAAVVGHLTESLVPREQLSTVLNRIHSTLDETYIYLNFNVKVINLDERTLGFWVEIPILTGDTYTAWSVSVTPFYDGSVRQIVPEISQVGVGLNSGKYIPLESCFYSNPGLCPAPIEYHGMTCVEGLLSRDARKIQTCPTTVMTSAPQLAVKRISNGVIMLYSEGETIQERCPEEPIRSFSLDHGTYTLLGQPGCVLSSSNGWQFKPLAVNNLSINTTDVFVLGDLDIKFHDPPPTAIAVPTVDVSIIEHIVQLL